MNQYVTGAVIKELREKNNITQSERATILNVSDKAVSKWETAKGYPDISVFEFISITFIRILIHILNDISIFGMVFSYNLIL